MRLAGRHGLDTVVLSGGCFQNRRLLEQTAAPLTAAGVRVLTHERVPPNDGGIAYGQAAIAAARMGEAG
jgi:hydrogenase maturation protein HypF